MTEMYKKIGIKLLEMRVSKDIRPSFIASALGVSVQQYKKYETGQNRIPLDKFICFCDAIQHPCGYALEDIKERLSNV